MGFPRFLVGQEVSAFDKSNNIVEGIIYKTAEGVKVVKAAEDVMIPLSELKTVKFVGKRLDEEIEEKIKNFSDKKMNWEQAVKDNSDSEKLADQFGNFCAAALGDKGNQEEVKEIAKSEAEMKIMDAKVKNGVSSKDAEIAKYIDMKSDKIKEAEMIVKNKLQEGDMPFEMDYGQDNTYPVNPDTRNSKATEYEDGLDDPINPDADQTLMAGQPEIVGEKADAVPTVTPESKSIEDEVLKDAENLEAMKTDTTIVEANPEDTNTADIVDEDDEYTKSLAEIDDILNDDYDDIDDKESGSRLDSLKTEVVEKTGVSNEKADTIISDIKNDVESAIVHGVKDILNAYDTMPDKIDHSDITNAVADAVTDIDAGTFDNQAASYVEAGAYDDYENDEIDDEVEAAIDEYAENNEDYNETDLYESLCKKFAIKNGDQILLEANGIIPDAILLMTDQIRVLRK